MRLIILILTFQASLLAKIERFRYAELHSKRECLQERMRYLRDKDNKEVCAIFTYDVDHWVSDALVRRDFFCGAWRFIQYCAHKDTEDIKVILQGDGGYDNWAYSGIWFTRDRNVVYRNLRLLTV